MHGLQSSTSPAQTGHLQLQRCPDHIDSFFNKYPTFDYQHSAPSWAEFERLCDYFDWGESFKMRQARQDLKAALTLQFNDIYGTDADSLASWHKLCRVLNVDQVPEGLKECRQVSTARSSQLSSALKWTHRVVMLNPISLSWGCM